MAKKNNRLEFAFGDLNQINKPYTEVSFDPSDTTVLGSLKTIIDNQYKSKTFEKVGLLKGIVLRVETPSDNNANSIWNFVEGFVTKPLKQLKVRIPEIHAALPEPSLYGDVPIGPHQRIIDLYPTFIAADEDASKEDIAVSDIVIVDFADKTNFTQPVYIKKFADGPGSAGDSSPSKNGIYYPNQSAEGSAAFNTSNGLRGTGKFGCGGSTAPPKNTPFVQGCNAPASGFLAGPTTGTRVFPSAVGASKLQRAQNLAAMIKSETGVGLSVRLLYAFMQVESGGKTATKNTIRFEPHVFLGMRGPNYKRLKGKATARPDLYGGPRYTGSDKVAYGSRYFTKSKAEWAVHPKNKKKYLNGKDYFIDRHRDNTNRAAFDRAFKLDPKQAIRSTSWGQYQVMGGALLRAYNNDPHQAIAAYDADPMGTGDRMIVQWFKRRFRKASRRAVFTQDPPNFDGMVKIYNGPAQVQSYSPKLRKAYDRFSNIPETSTSPPAVAPPTKPPESTAAPTSPVAPPTTTAATPPQDIPPPGAVSQDAQGNFLDASGNIIISSTSGTSTTPASSTTLPSATLPVNAPVVPKPPASGGPCASGFLERHVTPGYDVGGEGVGGAGVPDYTGPIPPPGTLYPGAVWVPGHPKTKHGKMKGYNNIVLHTVSGKGRSRIAVNFFKGGHTTSSTHFVAFKSGKIVQMHDLTTKTWHAGVTNSTAIGIEHGAPGSSGPPPDFWAQPPPTGGSTLFVESAKLSAWLSDMFDIPIKRAKVVNGRPVERGIIPHSDVGTHRDPGIGFPWDRYLQLVRSFSKK